MQNMYQALAAAHRGFEVVDVKFTANLHEADDQQVAELDAAFADAIATSKEVGLDFRPVTQKEQD